MRAARSLLRTKTWWVVSLLACSGCAAVVSNDGANFVFRQSVGVPVLLGLFGLAFTIVGAVTAIQAVPYLAASKPAKKKSKKKRPTQLNGVLQFAFGGLTAAFGLCLIFLGTPSTLLSTVTVKPDGVIFREGRSFFATTVKDIPFDTISETQVIEQETRGSKGRRKTKKYWIIAHDGGQERIEMNPMHLAAQPKFDELLAAYQAQHSELEPTDAALATTETVTPATNPTAAATSPTPEPASTPQPAAAENVAASATAAGNASPGEKGLTVVPRRGRFQAGAIVAIFQNGQLQNGTIEHVYAEGKISVRPDVAPSQTIVVPMPSASVSAAGSVAAPVPPGPAVGSTSEVKPGETLMSVWGAYWYPVRVEAIQSERYLALSWIGEPPGGQHAVPVSQVCRLPKIGEALIRAAQGEPVDVAFPRADGREQDWALLAKKFKVNQVVMAQFGGVWLPATILVIRDDGMMRVHYHEFENSADAELAPQQVREPTAQDLKKMKSQKGKK